MSRQNIIYGNNFRNARLARARSGKIHFRAARHQKAKLRGRSVVAVTLGWDTCFFSNCRRVFPLLDVVMTENRRKPFGTFGKCTNDISVLRVTFKYMSVALRRAIKRAVRNLRFFIEKLRTVRSVTLDFSLKFAILFLL